MLMFDIGGVTHPQLNVGEILLGGKLRVNLSRFALPPLGESSFLLVRADAIYGSFVGTELIMNELTEQCFAYSAHLRAEAGVGVHIVFHFNDTEACANLPHHHAQRMKSIQNDIQRDWILVATFIIVKKIF